MRHNNIRDFDANLLRKLHNDVETEPELQPITTERLRGLSNDQCKPDIRARGVWRDAQNAYFDIRVTNINPESQKHLPIKTILMKHEKEKKRSYNSRIMKVEHGTFTPLVFSVLGAKGPETSTFHRYIATKIGSKTEERYERVLSLIRCKLSFLILKSTLMCIRGSRPFDRESVTIDDFSLSCDAARFFYFINECPFHFFPSNHDVFFLFIFYHIHCFQTFFIFKSFNLYIFYMQNYYVYLFLVIAY